MPEPKVHTGKVYEQSDVRNLAAVVGGTQQLLTEAAVTDFDFYVYDLSSATPATAVYSDTAVSPSGVVLTTPLTGNGWPYDDDGYNFVHVIEASNFTMQGGHQYRIEYLLNTVSFNLVAVVFQVKVEPLYSR